MGHGDFDVMNGTHTMPAIPPYCKEVKTRVEIVEWRGDRVLMRDLGMAAKGIGYLIEDDIDSVVLDPLWRCPVCRHVMTEDESKGYRGCPTGMHFAQHTKV